MKTCALLLSLLVTLAGFPVWAEDEIVTGPDRRNEIDLRIEQLDAKRAEISTTGPKVATVLGLGMAVAGGAMLGVGASDCQNRDQDGCDLFGVTMAGAALTCIGIVTSLAGGVVWGVRANQRNKIDAERETLIEERDGIMAALPRIDLRSAYRDDTHFVTLGVRF